jgi:hypothetical protein
MTFANQTEVKMQVKLSSKANKKRSQVRFFRGGLSSIAVVSAVISGRFMG